MKEEDKIKEAIYSIIDNVNLTNDPVMKPISLALCARLKRNLPQICFSKEISGEVETIELSFKFDIDILSCIEKDPLSSMMQVMTDECIKKFESYNPFTVTFCGIYKTDEKGKLNVIFKIVK